MDESVALPVCLPSPTDAHAPWVRLHQSQSWPELIDAVGDLLAGRPEVRTWALADTNDDGTLSIRGPHVEGPVAEVLHQAVSTRSVIFCGGTAGAAGPIAAAGTMGAAGAAGAMGTAGATYGVPLVVGDSAIGGLALIFADDDAPSWSRWADLIAHVGAAARNVSLIEVLRARTVRDETTGLFNARHLESRLELELSRSRRFGHSVAVLFIDLDHFKAVNDRFGHLTGTGLLVEVAHRLVATIRSADSAFRYGGDEFVLMLVETTREAAKTAGQRVQRSLCERSFLTPGGVAVPISVSIGVAAYPEDGETAPELLRAADGALYHAKRAGRNHVVSTDDLTRTG